MKSGGRPNADNQYPQQGGFQQGGFQQGGYQSGFNGEGFQFHGNDPFEAFRNMFSGGGGRFDGMGRSASPKEQIKDLYQGKKTEV